MLLLPLALGCASQGPLRPPSLHLPGTAEKLAATRVGDHIELTWVTPDATTDGEKIKGAISANVCLDSAPNGTVLSALGAKKTTKRTKKHASVSAPAATGPVCNAVQHLGVTPGPAKVVVELGSGLAAGAPRLAAYRIELLNDRGRSAGASAPVLVAAGAAPAATGPLTVSAERTGAVVEWKAGGGPAVVELKRTLLATAAGPVAAAPVKQAKAPAPFAPTAKEPPREVVLRAEASKGMVDESVRDGDTYSYVAQRVETVTLSGQKLELRSTPSPVATFTFRNVFPPRAPLGLTLVPGGGFGEAPEIDLSWDANIEGDVTGYNVYRSEGVAFVKLNAELVAVPAYRDMHVEGGHKYTYRITAVDQRRNESAASAVATETLWK